MQNERADNRIDGAHAKLMQILGAQFLRDLQQPFDILAVRWIAGVFRLWTIIVHTPGQRFHGQHANVVCSEQVAQLLRTEVMDVTLPWRMSWWRLNECVSWMRRRILLEIRLDWGMEWDTYRRQHRAVAFVASTVVGFVGLAAVVSRLVIVAAAVYA